MVIADIFKHFPEENYRNFLTGQLISDDVSWLKPPQLLSFIKIEGSEILFSADILEEGNNRKTMPMRMKMDDPDKLSSVTPSPNEELNSYLFWIDFFDENTQSAKIQFLPCSKIINFESDFEIGFGDQYIQSNRSEKIEKIPEQLHREFVWDAGAMEALLVKTYINGSTTFTLYGLHGSIDVAVENEKWVVKKKKAKKGLPKNIDDLADLQIVFYNEIRFVEASQMRQTYESIRESETKGETLINLWERYSKIERDCVENLKSDLGEVKFRDRRFLKNGTSRVKLDLSEEQRAVFKEHRDELRYASFELVKEGAEEQKGDAKLYRVKLNEEQTRLLGSNDEVEFDDDTYTLPSEGRLVLSTKGDEVVFKRRERAVSLLRNQRRFLTTNLLFAIENKVESMGKKSRSEKTLTERTRSFLRKKFGIDGLTPDQEEAVRIAVNTPDIAIIQGPPGTGKTTVVAAICDRLLEIAERDSKKKCADRKLILVSAFQNDTVEHIASKVSTLGLPTIKVGKETQNSFKPEDKLVEDIRNHVNDSFQRLAPKTESSRLSKKLVELKQILEKENNKSDITKQIDDWVRAGIIENDALVSTWKSNFAPSGFKDSERDKVEGLVKSLRTTPEAYDDDGYKNLLRFSKKMDIDDNDRAFIESAPPEMKYAEPDFLPRLEEMKNKYLARILEESNEIDISDNASLKCWMDEAISWARKKESLDYEDEDTFLTSVLEEILGDLADAGYIRESIVNYGESIAATNQVSGSYTMREYSYFDNVVLEEAARSNPLDLLIPMTKATERIILVGDQKQLPHLLEESIAKETAATYSEEMRQAEAKKKLQESLFGIIFRNMEKSGIPRCITLKAQFRMHPAIGDFISRLYYNGELQPGMGWNEQAEAKQHRLQLKWAKDKVGVFCNVPKQSGKELGGKSKSRPAEAKRVFALLKEMEKDPEFENLSVGIITFYAQQVTSLYKEASDAGYAKKTATGEYDIADKYKETADGREKLRIGSVDSFQGKEFDIVILSTVRSNEIQRTDENPGKVFGFLTVENRLNVAFSRARKMIIVVGDAQMFEDEFAQKYVEGLFEFYKTFSDPSSKYGNRIQ